MPSATPTFGIRYPCQGEQISCVDFENFAEDVDNALTTVSTLRDTALHRPAISLATATTGFSVGSGAEATIGFDTIVFNHGMTVAAAPPYTTVSATRNGIYMVTAEFSPLNAVTTLTSWTGRVKCPSNLGRVAAGRTLARSIATTDGFNINVSGLGRMDTAAGSLDASATWIWTGTGGPMFVYCKFTVAFVCDA